MNLTQEKYKRKANGWRLKICERSGEKIVSVELNFKLQHSARHQGRIWEMQTVEKHPGSFEVWLWKLPQPGGTDQQTMVFMAQVLILYTANPVSILKMAPTHTLAPLPCLMLTEIKTTWANLACHFRRDYIRFPKLGGRRTIKQESECAWSSELLSPEMSCVSARGNSWPLPCHYWVQDSKRWHSCSHLASIRLPSPSLPSSTVYLISKQSVYSTLSYGAPHYNSQILVWSYLSKVTLPSPVFLN